MAKLTRSEWWSKYWKQVLIALFAGFVVLSAVSGEGWADYANKKFWQNAWVWWQIICIVAIIVLWCISWFTKRTKK